MKGKCCKLILEVLAAICGISAVLLTYSQIKESNSISRADFAYRFRTDFPKDQTRDLIVLFEMDLLKFKTDSNNIAYFELDSENLHKSQDSIKLQVKTKNIYSAYEIDNNLLMYLQNIGYYEDKKLMDIDFIYFNFYDNIVKVRENREISRYLEFIRRSDREYYLFIDKLSEKLKKKAGTNNVEFERSAKNQR